mgnify:CR=1 FL=1
MLFITSIGASMGEDAHYDARQTLHCLAKMVDKNETTRALLNLADDTEGMVVDVIPYKGTEWPVYLLYDIGNVMEHLQDNYS